MITGCVAVLQKFDHGDALVRVKCVHVHVWKRNLLGLPCQKTQKERHRDKWSRGQQGCPIAANISKEEQTARPHTDWGSKASILKSKLPQLKAVLYLHNIHLQ